MSVKTQEEIDALYEFIMGLRYQQRAVKSLRLQYESENAEMNHIPSYKIMTEGRQGPFCRPDVVPLTHRFAPDIGNVEAERLWQQLPSGWFHISVAGRKLNLSSPEMRRALYWMSKRRLIKYDNATFMYRRREGAQKGCFKNTPCQSGPYAKKSFV